MILDHKMTTIAYRCPACGSIVKSMIGAFSLSGDMMRLKCPCKESDMTVERKRDGKIRLTIPCFLCPNPHSYTISEKVFFGKELFTFPCAYTGVDIGFVGSAEEVEKAVDEADRTLAQMFDDADFEDVSCHNKERVFDDPQILDIILYIIEDLAEEGKIYCGCEDGGEYEVSVGDDSIFVNCKKCGHKAEIPAGSTLAANAFLHCDEIHLH